MCLGVVVIAFFFLRELSPQLRDQLMVSERERALVEALAKGIDVQKATRHPIRSMMRLDLIASSIAISVFLLFYYASVSVLTIYWVVTFNRTTPQANGINVWLAAFLSGGLVLAGLLSDWARVRKPFMLVGAICAMVMMGFLIRQTDHPHTGYYSNVLVIVLLAVSIALRLRALDGQLHRAGRVAQPGADRVGAGDLGMDPAHHGRALLPGAALRDHDVDRPRGQPGRAATALQAIQAAEPYAPVRVAARLRRRSRRPRPSSPACRSPKRRGPRPWPPS